MNTGLHNQIFTCADLDDSEDVYYNESNTEEMGCYDHIILLVDVGKYKKGTRFCRADIYYFTSELLLYDVDCKTNEYIMRGRYKLKLGVSEEDLS
jgi:hypothetical protein